MFIKNAVKKNKFFLNMYKDFRYFYYKNFWSDEALIRKQFLKKLNRPVDLKNPKMYNDKLQWLKLNWRDDRATICADKYEVRKYVEHRIGKQYLNDFYALYESVDEIDINILPESFVLKAAHGSGDNIICKNKKELNWGKANKVMRKWLKKNLYWSTREWVYKDIKPRIICEKYLSDETGNPPMDYKIFCFHGEPKLIQVDIDRFGGHKQNFYNIDWSPKDIQVDGSSESHTRIEKPRTLVEMLELSKLLSKDFPHVRVDFYDVNGQIIFGELTFFHRNGLGKFKPLEIEEELGELLDLSILN